MFQVDIMSRVPVYEQIVEQLEEFVLAGIMKEGDRLPSVRALSMQLAVNPNTIQKAYSELDRRGLIQSVPGKGCFITPEALEKTSSRKRQRLAELAELVRELLMAGVSGEEIRTTVDEIVAEERKER